MKNTSEKFKERLRRPASNKQLTMLWMLFGISLLLDCLYVIYFSHQYNCSASQLLYVRDFNWISPVFGIVDLLIGYIIFKKTIIHINLNVYDFIFNGNANKRIRIVIPKIIRYDYHSVSKMLSVIVIATSLLSLAIDFVKFFI